MQRSASRRVVVGLGLSGLVFLACARASLEDATDDLTEDDASAGTVPSGGKLDAAPPRPTPTSTSTTPVPTPDPVDDAGVDGNPPVVDAGPDAPGPTPVTCDFTNACPSTVTKIGTVSGNLTNGTVTATGSTSEWIQVAVKDEGFLWGDLKLRVKLTSPAGTQYGLLAYEAAPAATACTAPKQQDLGVDALKTMNFGWTNALGDDGKSMTFEVRHIAGDCGATKTWKLEVTGTP